jgi:hypothetical protein
LNSDEDEEGCLAQNLENLNINDVKLIGEKKKLNGSMILDHDFSVLN